MRRKTRLDRNYGKACSRRKLHGDNRERPLITCSAQVIGPVRIWLATRPSLAATRRVSSVRTAAIEAPLLKTFLSRHWADGGGMGCRSP
jgi:hypothetical protein